MKMMDRIRSGICSFLRIQPASPNTIYITERLDRRSNAIKNRIWYRGSPEELAEMYRQLDTDRTKFWAAVPTVGMDIRKIHTGIPAIIVDRLTDIVLTDMNDIILPPNLTDVWKDISAENAFSALLGEAVAETLIVGDGAFKISFDTSLSPLPIVEFIAGDNVEFERERGRLRAIVCHSHYTHEGREYELHETYGKGFIESRLFSGSRELPLSAIPQTAKLSERVEYAGDFCMAVPLKFFQSSRWHGRGKSIFDDKCDAFDALDECWSQWIDALRKGRTKEYIPDNMLPRNPQTGEVMSPNPFDNAYIQTQSVVVEGVAPHIETVQPTIPVESYLGTYITALDLCLQGLISPSTLGIDVKKLDNAEAQREKEKATLYTRNSIVATLQDVIPTLIDSIFKAYDTFYKRPISDIADKVEIPFGEYANPSFESQVETCGKARQFGLMSVETMIDELYGDTRTHEWKTAEAARIKAEQGLTEGQEPSLQSELYGLGNTGGMIG
ncbi:MAG: capsid protein [Ruminococcus sp.]|nr:capsid protein [Ruminococcus sp.]